ncbi:MAG: carboxypeptidase-like regulatory domain-containing protein [Acidobacteriia bacterium]|nr:carboxypeptidase-like regulatory domain-containing protein [Terriglobia bacterium]
MELTRILLAAMLAGILLPAHQLSAEVICGKKLRLKPLRCVCGRLTDTTGGPVPGVVVRVLKNGAEVASVQSDQDGNFVFDELKPGNYELNAQPDGYLVFRTQIVVAKPEKRCRRRLAILLEVRGENCGSLVMKQ